ncbi:MAG: hypothetical protein V1820_01605 [archaeon]
MDEAELCRIAAEIVGRAIALKDFLTDEKTASVGYCCIYCHDPEEYRARLTTAAGIGKIVRETPTGPFILLREPIQTAAGSLHILKIRAPDPTHPELGHADFTAADYRKLKKWALGREGFKLIVRKEHEMIELKSPEFKDVRAYFPDPPIETILGI